ncbi:MAG TPA: M23 family metallopeptidase, partial [Rhizobiales bacterium]|nr:M23 family metallopeptidase [Hyphomicrobiales bacterium]
ELKSFGNLILIRHPNGWVTAYAHNRRLLVKEGARVKTGDTIAEVGATGSVAVPQLHFETRRGRLPVNPLLHLPRRG